MAGWAFGEGPRDKLLERGAAALSDGELLALLLNTGYRDCSALDAARNLLKAFGGISGLIRSDQRRLLACSGVGPAKYARLCAAMELARREALQKVSAAMCSPAPAKHGASSNTT